MPEENGHKRKDSWNSQLGPDNAAGGFKEEKEHDRNDSWHRVEQVARISAQFATVLALAGGLLGVIALISTGCFACEFREVMGISVERFLNIPLVRLEYKSKLGGVIDFLTIFIQSGFLLGVVGLIVYLVIRLLLGKLPREPRANMALILVGILLCLLYRVLMHRVLMQIGKYWHTVLIMLIASAICWAVLDFVRYHKLITRLLLLMGVVFTFSFLLLWFTASAMTSAYYTQVIGWMQGVAEVCRSPQVIFEKGEFSNQAVFLLVRTDTEYYVFTDTIVVAPPPLPKEIAIPLLTPIRGNGCSPANIIILPAANVGTAKVIRNGQLKPGKCCYQFGPTPTPIPAPTPSATPDP